METWWRVSVGRRGSEPSITPVRVASTTDHWLILDTKDWRGKVRREKKRTEYDQHFATWAEAHNALVVDAKLQITRAKNALVSAQKHYAAVRELEPPPDSHEGGCE